MLLLVVFYLLKFTRNIMQTEYMAPIVTFRLYECNRFKCVFSPYDRKCFIALHSFFTSVVEYSLNQFPCHRHFLWKPWVNKLVTLCSHEHFQFQFHLISQSFYPIDPEHFQKKLTFRNSRRTDFSQFSSLWMLLWVFLPTRCSHRIFPRRCGKHTCISVQGCCSLCEEITSSAFKVWKCS